MPLVSGLSSNDVALAARVVSGDSEPGLVPRDTANPVSGLPPLFGSGQVRCTILLPLVAVTTGAAGAVGASGVTDFSAERVSPLEFTAATS